MNADLLLHCRSGEYHSKQNLGQTFQLEIVPAQAAVVVTAHFVTRKRHVCSDFNLVSHCVHRPFSRLLASLVPLEQDQPPDADLRTTEDGRPLHQAAATRV